MAKLLFLSLLVAGLVLAIAVTNGFVAEAKKLTFRTPKKHFGFRVSAAEVDGGATKADVQCGTTQFTVAQIKQALEFEKAPTKQKIEVLPACKKAGYIQGVKTLYGPSAAAVCFKGDFYYYLGAVYKPATKPWKKCE